MFELKDDDLFIHDSLKYIRSHVLSSAVMLQGLISHYDKATHMEDILEHIQSSIDITKGEILELRRHILSVKEIREERGEE